MPSALRERPSMSVEGHEHGGVRIARVFVCAPEHESVIRLLERLALEDIPIWSTADLAGRLTSPTLRNRVQVWGQSVLSGEWWGDPAMFGSLYADLTRQIVQPFSANGCTQADSDATLFVIVPAHLRLAEPEGGPHNIDFVRTTLLKAAAISSWVSVVCSSFEQCEGLSSALAEHGYLHGVSIEELKRNSLRSVLAHEMLSFSEVKQETSDKLPGPFAKVGGFLFDRIEELRYGENPHLQGFLCRWPESARTGGAATAELVGVQPQEQLSYNNLHDIDAGMRLLSEFSRDEAAICIIKHANPSGIAVKPTLAEAFRAARLSHSQAAFGGIVGANHTVDTELAKSIVHKHAGFLNLIFAPAFDDEALAVLKQKPSISTVRVIMPSSPASSVPGMREISGGLLFQDSQNDKLPPLEEWKFPTRVQPTDDQLSDLFFAWRVVKHVNSNAIVLAKEGATLGIGGGQPSRVDSVNVALMVAKQSRMGAAEQALSGCVMASDGFFPKTDAVEAAINFGVRAIVQPGGSKADKEIIRVCDEAGIPMAFTGTRHFLH